MTKLSARHTTVFFILPIILGSCATILNGPVQKIQIATDGNIRHVSVDKCVLVDSSSGDGISKSYYVVRSNQSLVVHLQLDSSERTLYIKSRNSFAWWINIYFNYGLGMLVDMNNPKRYAYPRNNYFMGKGMPVYRRRSFMPVQKGTLRISLGLPLVNIFNLTIPGERYHGAGIAGLEPGLDYFYKNNQYLSLSLGGGASVRERENALGAPCLETSRLLFASFRNNRVIGRFDIGYGINFSCLIWHRAFADYSVVRADQSFNSTGLGLSFSAQYRLGNYARISVLYQPVLFTNQSTAVNYQHYISAGFTWKWPVGKRR